LKIADSKKFSIRNGAQMSLLTVRFVEVNT